MPGKKKGGRPSLYKPEFPALATAFCRLGATNAELAKCFGVATSTIIKWLKETPEFSVAIKKGREIADANVATSLYHRAIGYHHPDVDIRVIENKIVKTELVKHYPPDTAACFIWLKNRRPDLWRDKVEPGDDDSSSTAQPVSVSIIVEDASKPKSDGGKDDGKES